MNESVFPSQQQEKFVLRLPDGMRDRIKDAAQANNRSMNAEIIARLEASFNFDGMTGDLVADLNGRVDKLTDMLNDIAKDIRKGEKKEK